MDLYFAPLSCSLATRIALYESGQEAGFHQVVLATKQTTDGRDYLAINPKGQVPALVTDAGDVLTEGPAVLQYVADRAPESGLAPAAARYAGFSARASLWTALLMSGGMAGLAGAMEAAGPLRQLTPHVSTGYGFTAIIVCFVGRLHPMGIVFSGVLLSMLLIGGELGQSRLGLPNALTGVFQGLLLFLLLACDTLIHYRVRRRRPAAAATARATA